MIDFGFILNSSKRKSNGSTMSNVGPLGDEKIRKKHIHNLWIYDESKSNGKMCVFFCFGQVWQKFQVFYYIHYNVILRSYKRSRIQKSEKKNSWVCHFFWFVAMLFPNTLKLYTSQIFLNAKMASFPRIFMSIEWNTANQWTKKKRSK